MSSQQLYPVFLKLIDRAVVVVGGGRVAAAKIPALLSAGASVTVVAPEVRPEVPRADVEVRLRRFEPADLDGAFYAVAAATPEVDRQVAAAADARRIFVNAVDDAQAASACLGGIVRKGGVTVAVSTDGAAPALAGLLREALEAVLPDDAGAWVARAKELRREWLARGLPIEARRPLLLEALNRLYAAKEVR